MGRYFWLLSRIRLTVAAQKAFPAEHCTNTVTEFAYFGRGSIRLADRHFFPNIYLDFITHALIFENIFAINRSAVGRRDSLTGHGDKEEVWSPAEKI